MLLHCIPWRPLEAATDAVAFNVLLSEVPEVNQALRLLEKMRKMVLLPTVVTMNAGELFA